MVKEVEFRVITVDAIQFFAWLEQVKTKIRGKIVIFDGKQEAVGLLPVTAAGAFDIAAVSDDMEVVLIDSLVSNWSAFQAKVKEMALFPMIGRLKRFTS
jgi:hypothetical protein